MNKTSSFTLIELLVVIAIVGILAGVIIVAITGVTYQATIAKAKVFSNSMRDSMGLSLISEWKFDGVGVTDGSTINSSYMRDTWSNNNLTLTGSGVIVSSGDKCVSGSCISISSTNNYVSAKNSVFDIGYGSMTVEFWVLAKDYTYPHTRLPVGNYSAPSNGLPCWNVDSGYISNGTYIDIGDGTNRGQDTIQNNVGYKPVDTINKWTHTVIVFDRTIGRVYQYINGLKQSSYVDISTITGYISNTSSRINIGNVAGWYVNGSVDDVRIYKAAISQSAIRHNYLAGIKSLLGNRGITQQEYDQRLATLDNYCLAIK